MSARSKVAYRNRSPYGWWVASYILRLEYDGEGSDNPRRRCVAWENTIILTAPNRESAYRKALRLGKAASGGEVTEVGTGRKGSWVFEGLTELLPIYDELEDGAEILWSEHEGKSVGTVRSWVRSKEKLSVFDDGK